MPDPGTARTRRDREGGFAVVPVAVGLCAAMIALTVALAVAVVRAVA